MFSAVRKHTPKHISQPITWTKLIRGHHIFQTHLISGSVAASGTTNLSKALEQVGAEDAPDGSAAANLIQLF